MIYLQHAVRSRTHNSQKSIKGWAQRGGHRVGNHFQSSETISEHQKSCVFNAYPSIRISTKGGGQPEAAPPLWKRPKAAFLIWMGRH